MQCYCHASYPGQELPDERGFFFQLRLGSQMEKSKPPLTFIITYFKARYSVLLIKNH